MTANQNMLGTIGSGVKFESTVAKRQLATSHRCYRRYETPIASLRYTQSRTKKCDFTLFYSFSTTIDLLRHATYLKASKFATNAVKTL